MIPMALQGYIWFGIESARIEDNFSRCGLARSWRTGEVGSITRSMYMSEGTTHGSSRFRRGPIRIDSTVKFVTIQNRTLWDGIEVEGWDTQIHIENVRMEGNG